LWELTRSIHVSDFERKTMRTLLRNALVVLVAVLGWIPVLAARASSGPCDGHGGVASASAEPLAADVFDIALRCADGQHGGPFRFRRSGA
jgi:hypothetical protein